MTTIKQHNTLNINSWREKLLELESSICEGLHCQDEISKDINIYQRPILQQTRGDLSYVSGLSYSGLRVNAILSTEKLRDCWKQLQMGVRQNLPITINVDNYSKPFNRSHSNPELLDLEVLQLVSSNSQEAIDFALIAHRVSEKALIPSVHQISVNDNSEIMEMSKLQLDNFLGNPEDWIKVPTPSQAMIFGPERRRIPQWFNLDTPALLGSQKDPKSLTREKAAHEVYFEGHLNKILSDTFIEFEELTGRRYDVISTYNVEKPSFLLITVGNNPESTARIIDELKRNNIKMGLLNINVINPFPYAQIANLISGKKAVSILQPLGNNSNWLISRIKELASDLKNMPSIISGKYNNYLSVKEILAVTMNMTSKNPQKNFYCDVAFTKKSSVYPKYQVILQEVDRNYPELKNLSLQKNNGSGPEIQEFQKLSVSPITRQYKDLGAPFTQLSRFLDNTALFYLDDNSDEIIAEPFQAIPSTPAGATSLLKPTGERDQIPVITSEKCTACGDCLIHCPYSAMPSVSIGFENLIKAGIEMANNSGTQIINLLPLTKNLSNLAGKIISELNGDTHPSSVKSILDPAFDHLVLKMKLDGEKLEKVKLEYEIISRVLEKMPVFLSDYLYRIPESQQKGKGELFFVTVDPNSCTGCGLCANVCAEDAIQMETESADLVQLLVEKIELWEKLPDTSPDTINRLLFEKDYNSFAALLLSRNFYYSLVGGDNGESRSTSRQLIHLISTLSESIMQPRYGEFIKVLNELVHDLSENIHAILSSSLPKENFDNIAKAIENTSKSKVPFDEIISNISKEDRLKQVDARDIKRKIELLQSLEVLKWSLFEGPTGVGRARTGINMIDGGGFEWATNYPLNPFISPTLVWDSEYSGELTSGILDGQTRSIVDNLKLIRKAKLEVKNKYVPKEHDNEIAKLSWDGLNKEEKKLVPPILLISKASTLSEKKIYNYYSGLLASDRPIKILLLENLSAPFHDLNGNNNIAARLLSYITSKNAFVFQGSYANPQFLFDGLIHGLNTSTPALFSLYLPDPNNHNPSVNSFQDLSRMALNTRTFPNVIFNPERFEGFLNNCLDLTNNPSLEKDWITETLQFKEGNDVKSLSFDVTWADWAFTLNNWESHFEEYNQEDGIHISDYISSGSNTGTPIIYRVRNEKLIIYKVSPEVVNQTRSVKEYWDLIREFSGDLIQFPAKLKKQVEKEVREKFEAELNKIKSEYDNKLKEKEQEQVAAIRKKLRDKLIELTTKKK